MELEERVGDKAHLHWPLPSPRLGHQDVDLQRSEFERALMEEGLKLDMSMVAGE